MVGVPWSFVRYCLVGLVNTATDLTVFGAMTGLLGASPVHANIVSYTTALLMSFVLNRNFTFRDAGQTQPLAQLYRFVTVNLGCLAISTAGVWLLAAEITPIGAKLATIPVVTLVGFVAVRLFVFRPNQTGDLSPTPSR